MHQLKVSYHFRESLHTTHKMVTIKKTPLNYFSNKNTQTQGWWKIVKWEQIKMLIAQMQWIFYIYIGYVCAKSNLYLTCDKSTYTCMRVYLSYGVRYSFRISILFFCSIVAIQSTIYLSFHVQLSASVIFFNKFAMLNRSSSHSICLPHTCTHN